MKNILFIIVLALFTVNCTKTNNIKENELEIKFTYLKHSDFVFHILAYLKVDNASDLYDEEYISKMAIVKPNLDYNIVPDINSLKDYYNQNTQRLGMINFLPFYCNEFIELKNLLVNYNQFTNDDIQYFINPFIEIMEKESVFYFDYWDNMHNNNIGLRNSFEEYIRINIKQFSKLFEYYNKASLVFPSYSLTRNGRGFPIDGYFSAATQFPKNEAEFENAFFILLHEYTHQFTDTLLNTNINFDDGSHNLSEYVVILADYYLIRAINEELIQNYLKMFNGNITENEYLNIYKVDESLEIKIKELIKDIIEK